MPHRLVLPVCIVAADCMPAFGVLQSHGANVSVIHTFTRSHSQRWALHGVFHTLTFAYEKCDQNLAPDFVGAIDDGYGFEKLLRQPGIDALAALCNRIQVGVLHHRGGIDITNAATKHICDIVGKPESAAFSDTEHDIDFGKYFIDGDAFAIEHGDD